MRAVVQDGRLEVRVKYMQWHADRKDRTYPRVDISDEITNLSLINERF